MEGVFVRFHQGLLGGVGVGSMERVARPHAAHREDLQFAGFAAQLFFVTFGGAVRRGRDSFFASAATASILVVLCESFLDSSLLSPSVQIIVAVMVGLGLAQSAGRTGGVKR